MTAEDALEFCARLPVRTVFDIGPGSGVHLREFRNRGKEVFALCPHSVEEFEEVTFRGRFPEILSTPAWKGDRFDLIWSSHCLEHQENPQAFLKALHSLCHPQSFLAITVPPRKDRIVSGHLTLWNAGLLLQHLILAGFDCSRAGVKSYGYNVSVVLPYEPYPETLVRNQRGDIELSRIGRYLPQSIVQDPRGSYDGWIFESSWQVEGSQPPLQEPPTSFQLSG